jgi:ABC-2 type transport system permease protein
MKLHRLAAIAIKEVLQIVRDARSVGIVVAMPVAMMLAFGYGISLDVKHLPVYVFDREGSQQSQDLLKQFQAS